MKRLKLISVWHLINGLAILFLVSKLALAESVLGTSAKELGVSGYRHFVIYPHLEKALKAQKNQDELVALREFEHIHGLAPESIPLALYLVEAYRYFGYDDRARILLQEQITQHPNDLRLQKQLQALPIVITPITTVAALRLQQQQCDAAPTTDCRSTVGQNALKLKELDIVREQLTDLDFAQQPQGKSLQKDLLQRAIYLQNWQVVDEVFSQINQERKLSATEMSQWFNALASGQRYQRVLALQANGGFSFETADQEKSWLYLLSNVQANSYDVLANYPVQFKENIDFVASEVLAPAMRAGDKKVAKHILSTVPDDAYLEERYALSLLMHDEQEILRVALALYKQHPSDIRYLNQLSWQLFRSGKSKEAAQLLVNNYPFSGNSESVKTLLVRLSDLLSDSPHLITATQKNLLLQPLPTVELRQVQSTLSWFANDCQAVQHLLGDLSSSYQAEAWKLLAVCYRNELPGLGLYAYQQAAAREPNAYNYSAIAYQAYQVKDYKEALRAWKLIQTQSLSDQDLKAATSTAQAAQDNQARDAWLAEQKKRGLDNTEHYWWLHAQRYLPEQPELALADFNHAIEVEPTARAYAARAAIYRQQHKLDEAIQDLQQSVVLDPDNKALQAELGYALWDKKEFLLSREAHEKALAAMPDDPALLKQLTYVNQRLDDVPRTQHYARQVIDDLDYLAQAETLTLDQNQELFNFRRLHEDISRRWTMNVDMSIGLSAESVGATSPVIGATPNKNYRSFGQMELGYRLGRNQLVEGDLLSLYGRVYGDTGTAGTMLPTKDPMLGVGVRWKPLRDSVFFIALEQQVPLSQQGDADTMLRVSASLLNGGRFSDDWHPNGKGWLAQNLYLDAAHYLRKNTQSWTADYRLSWHHKIAGSQTVEPYAHVQTNGYKTNKNTQGSQLVGVGARWNIWSGETHYDAWPHKLSLGLEYQRTLNTINQKKGKRNNLFFTFGVSW